MKKKKKVDIKLNFTFQYLQITKNNIDINYCLVFINTFLPP